MLAISAGMMAVPAKRGIWRTVKLANGTEVKVELRGDEHASFWQAEDGSRYVQDNNNLYRMAEAGEIEATARLNREKAAAAKQSEALRKAKANGRKNAAYSGDKRGLIILIEYADMAFRAENTKELYNDIANKEGFTSERGFVGSIHDYFYEQSGGQLNLTFDVAGPVKLTRNYAYYGANLGESKGVRAGTMVAEACKLADSEVDFSKYDWDGDGSVDQVVVIYAGRGEATGGDENTIWPHEGYLLYSDYFGTLRLDGKYINKYACSSELKSETGIDGIGTFCHEFSHCLGLPDFYDTDYSGGYGMNEWDLMHQGSYNGGGFVPCNYTAYEKEVCGWMQMTVLDDDFSTTEMKTLTDGGQAYVIRNKGNSNEYYILENRQKTGWDAELPGSGILITHVDYNRTIWNNNKPNDDPDHQRMSVIPADNSYADGSTGTDAWPYQGTNALTNTTTPAATTFNANSDGSKLMNVIITGIKNNGDGTMAFNFKNSASSVQTPDGTLFYESFDLCGGAGGNDNKWAGSGVAISSFVPDHIGWTCSKAFGGDRCASFGSNTQRGVLRAPEVEIGGKATLTFVAAPFGSAATTLSLSDELGNASISATSFSLKPGQWNECTAVITADKAVQLKLVGKRFFLDNVKIVPGDITAGISDITSQTANGNKIYRLDGTAAGTDWNKLQKGIYVVNGKKIVK